MKASLFIVLLGCLLLASEARIDNKFGGERQKKQERWAAHPDPVVPLDENPEQKNAIEGEAVKVKGHRGRASYAYEVDDGKAYLETNEPGNVHHGHKTKPTRGTKKEQTKKWKAYKSANEGKNITGRKSMKKMNLYKHEDSDQCRQLKCKRKHVCLVNGETGVAECVPKRVLRQSRKLERSMKAGAAGKNKGMSKKQTRLNKARSDKILSKKRTNLKKKAGSEITDLTAQHKKAHRMAKKIKNKAERFQNKYQEKKRRHLHHLKDGNGKKKSTSNGVPSVNELPLKSHNKTPAKYCSQKELELMGKRLLDWFKVLQDQSQHPHIIQKRNSKKKELHERDECICQAPVRSEFLRLDKDQNEILSEQELDKLETNGYEHCIKPFIDSCDHDKDASLSEREWCCCFADVLPPCLAEMNRVPASLTMGEPAVFPGAFVPQCDSDGFYKAVQCSGSTGYCWCVDRNGVTVQGTHTRGMPHCEGTDNVDKDVKTDKGVK